MKSVTDYLEALSRREKILEESGKTMKGGEVWSYPVELEKGVGYFFKVNGDKHLTVTGVLSNGNGAPPLREARGSKFVLSFVPDYSGSYGLKLSLDSAPDGMAGGKVVVRLSKEYMPSRYVNSMFR